jgi:hypothetical protein
MTYLPLNNGTHIHALPGPRFENCAYDISRKKIGIAHSIINMKYGIRNAPEIMSQQVNEMFHALCL